MSPGESMAARRWPACSSCPSFLVAILAHSWHDPPPALAPCDILRFTRPVIPWQATAV